MEAKDTVMENLAQAIIAHPNLPMGQAIAIEQAEISFKAGIKEVVEEYKKDNQWSFNKYEAWWKAKLKKWGIND